MRSGGSISIWFFIGISLLGNGLMIVGAGLYEFAHPPTTPVVLYGVHANIWWGGVLFLLGGLYCYCFAPGRQKMQE
jgi:hypothetical protein